MLRLQALLLLTIFFTWTSAAPRPVKRSFKVHRVRAENYAANGTHALKRAYAKYGIVRRYDENDIIAKRFQGELFFNTPSLRARQQNNGTVTTGPPRPARAQNDAEFLSPILVGGQQIITSFDSGSSDLWVFNTALPPQAAVNHQLYDPAKSTTARPIEGARFQISYGDGSFSNGPVSMESVDIGGATVADQVIGVPNNVSQSFIEDGASSGLVGLAFSRINTVQPQPANTFFANVAPNLSQQVFTANLRNGVTGAYEFGVIDNTQFEGQLTQVPVDSSQGFWAIRSDNFAVNGGAPQPVTVTPTAIADTGTSLMIVDPGVINAYYSQVPGAIDSQQVGGVVMPCDAPMPDLMVGMGDAQAIVSGQLMNFAEIGATNAQGQPMCFGGLQSNAGLANFAIYGDVFFKANFVAFQGTDPPSLGFAPHKAGSIQ